MIFHCPGSQKFKAAIPETVQCSHCGKEAEIWSDENKARCGNCNKVIVRQLEQSCLDWCKHSKECMGR